MVCIGGFNTLKQHREFQYIYKRGKNSHSDSVVLFFLPQQNTHKVGFTATKKLGNAVVRNRAKRKLRAIFREYSPNLQDGSYVFVAKASLYDASFEKLQQDFTKILRKSKVLTNV